MRKITLLLLLFSAFFIWAKAEQENLQACHKYFSVNCFNQCWNLLAADSLSEENSQKMILLASTSLWHWQQREDVTPRNLSVGYWQLAKTYVKAKKPESALAIAQRCLEKSLEAELSAFYLGYAYEVMAWANLLNNNTNKALQNLNTATNYLAKIKDEEEKQYLQADLLKLETKLAN